MRIELNFEGEFAADFRALARALGETRDLNRVIATVAAEVTQSYLLALNAGRHPTARAMQESSALRIIVSSGTVVLSVWIRT